MAQVTLGGNPVQTNGELPKPGEACPPMVLIKNDLSELSLQDLRGKKIILNIFPSIDTPTCSKSVKIFNQKASATTNTVILCISADLPFAQKRFCGSEGIENVMAVSTFRDPSSLDRLGVRLITGKLKDLAARAVLVLDEEGKVIHTELVSEIANEPNYESALSVL
jgi:thioredoxin-dependent peroxiredoxin